MDNGIRKGSFEHLEGACWRMGIDLGHDVGVAKVYE